MKKQKQYAASRAHTWAYCEPSENLTRESKNPFKRATPEQSEGVAIHAAIHAAFAPTVKLTSEQKTIIEASDDAESVIQFCVDAVNRLIERYEVVPQIFFEGNFDYKNKTLSVAARPDCVLWWPSLKILVVVDFKTGFVPVEAEGNEQLKIYVHAFCHAQGVKPGAVEGVIVQPRLSTIDYTTIHHDSNFFDTLAAELQKREGRFVVGTHCKNCGALTTCKLFRETAKKYFEPALKDGLQSRPEEWQKLVAIARPMKKFAEEILDETKNYLEMGGRLENVGLTKSAGKRAWFRELTTEEIAEKLGVPVAKITDPAKIKSPAQAEKAVPKDAKERLRALVYQPQNLSVNITGDTNFLSSDDGAEKIICVETGFAGIFAGNKKGKEKGKTNGKTKTSAGKGAGKKRKR